MKKFYAHFEPGKVRELKSGLNIPLTYDFWPLLISYFIEKSDVFHIDCWIDEIEGIERASLFGRNVESYNENVKSFEGRITKEFVQEIVNKPFDQEGKVKWFNIDFKKGTEMFLSCQHNGCEFVTGWLNSKDAEYIKSVIPEDFSFHTFRG